MVKITIFENSSNAILGFDIFGHANGGTFGKDIICAAISSAVYMVLNTITDVKHIVPTVMKLKDGYASFRLDIKDAESCTDLLRGFCMHVHEISKQSPKKVCVIYKKI